MQSRQTLKLGYLDATYVVSGEVETLSCHWYNPIRQKPLSEQFICHSASCRPNFKAPSSSKYIFLFTTRWLAIVDKQTWKRMDVRRHPCFTPTVVFNHSSVLPFI